MNKLTDDRYETRRRDNGEQARYERKVLKMIGSVIGGMIIAGAVASAVFATDWTIDRGDGVHIPNPRCLSKHCQETGIPDTPAKPDQRGDDHAPEWYNEIHNGFSCAYLGKWWVPGLSLGYEHSFVHAVADFIDGLSSGKPASPTFREALETTRVCDAILKSGKSRKWVNV